MPKWYEEKGNCSDVVIATRVRLERNYKKYPFSTKLADDEAKNLVEEIKKFCESTDVVPENFKFTDVSALDENRKITLVERQIISPSMIKKAQSCGYFLNKEETVGLLINGDDHVRVQTIYSGMNTADAYSKANTIDDSLSDVLEVAFDEKYGYLTSSPTNVGTGLRVSCLLFLPALSGAGKMNTLTAEVGKYGLVLSPIFGDDMNTKSALFQVSNQRTLGCTEQEIIENMNTLVAQIVKQERVRREFTLSKDYNMLEDQVYRAYGILKYTKQINRQEAVEFISKIMYGVYAGVLKLEEGINLLQLLACAQSNNLQEVIGQFVGSKTRDRFRAEYINKNLPEIAGQKIV